MWNQAKARRGYQTSSEKYEGSAADHHYLGAPIPDDNFASHPELSAILKNLNVSNHDKTRGSHNSFCGLTDGKDPFGASITPSQKYCRIEIGSKLIPGMSAAAKCFLALNDLMSSLWSMTTNGNLELNQHHVDDVTLSFRLYILEAMGRSQAPKSTSSVGTAKRVISIKRIPDMAPVIEEAARQVENSEGQIKDLVSGALAWTICHELAHALYVDTARGPDLEARSALFERVQSVMPREVSIAMSKAHQKEYACDLRAFQSIDESKLTDPQKYGAWPASILLATVIALWDNEDIGADDPSGSHPNAFNRAALVRLAFVDFLSDTGCFDLTALNDVTSAFIFSRLLGGEYTRGNRGIMDFLVKDPLGYLRSSLETFLGVQ